MSAGQYFGYGICAVMVLVAAVSSWTVHEERRKHRDLPKPAPDSRSWSINYMTDFKRWTR